MCLFYLVFFIVDSFFLFILFFYSFFFFFNDTATTEIYTLSLHDAVRSARSGRVRHGRLCDDRATSADRKNRRAPRRCRLDIAGNPADPERGDGNRRGSDVRTRTLRLPVARNDVDGNCDVELCPRRQRVAQPELRSRLHHCGSGARLSQQHREPDLHVSVLTKGWGCGSPGSLELPHLRRRSRTRRPPKSQPPSLMRRHIRSPMRSLSRFRRMAASGFRRACATTRSTRWTRNSFPE